LPQVASAPVISQPVRSDAPARPPGQSEPSGGFGEMLDASSAAPDAGGGKPASANCKEASAPAAQDTPPADSAQSANAPVPPVIDIALLAPEFSADAAAVAPPAMKQADGTEPAASDEVADKDTKAEVGGDVASAAADPKAAEVSLTVVLAPPPAPAAAPVRADADVAAISSSGPTPSIAAASKGAPAVQVMATDLSPPAADPDAAFLSQPARPSDTLAATVSGSGTTALDDPAQGAAVVLPTQRPVAEAVNGRVEDTTTESGDAAVALPAQTDAKPSSRPAAEAVNGKAENNATTSRKAEAHHTDAPHAGKTAQASPAADASNSTEQPAGPDAKPPAHQPHLQPSEHASAAARVAVTAAHSDVPTPGSVAQAVTAQVASTPPLFGINAAMPLASPLQSLWQPTPQRAESGDNTVPIFGLAVEIVSRAHEGLRRFEIRLDPPELGRIDVRLDVDRGGNVTSRLTVERAETLDLLRRDAPQLERALQQAGLNTEGGLQFSLRDQNFANRDQAQQNATTLIVPDDEPAATEAARRGYGRLIGLGGGVDIRV
jgi:flagellar hook-length control protein FliK